MTTTIRQTPLVCPGHNRGIVELQHSAITEEGIFLISACLDGKPMLRDAITGDWIGTFDGHKGAVWAATITPDASLAATGSADFTARVWNAVNGSCMHTFEQKHICKSVAFRPIDSSQLLTGGQAKEVNLYDLNQPEADPILFPVQCPSKVVRFVDQHGHSFLSGGTDGFLRLWDIRSGKVVSEHDTGAQIKSGQIDRDNNLFTLVNANGSIQLWNLNEMTLLKEIIAPKETESATLHPDLTRLVSCGQDLSVRVYDYQTKEQLEVHRGHHGPVWAVSYCPDGSVYASGSDDGTIRIWQTCPVPNTNMPVSIDDAFI